MTEVLYYGDNLDVMKNKIDKESIDLIYLDPPFNSNRNYNMIYKDATGNEMPNQDIAFCDKWKLDKEKEKKIRGMAKILAQNNVNESYITFWKYWVEALRDTQEELLAYLVYMVERLAIMKNLLKKTGCIYLHCDSTASHYIKIMMDGIFGHKNFRNEIIWKRATSKNNAKKFGVIHDVILFYTISDKYYWKNDYQEHDQEYIKKSYRYDDNDKRGLYRLSDLGQQKNAKGYYYKYKGYKCNDKGWRCPESTMIKYDENGELYFPEHKNQILQRKRYLKDSKGVPVIDIITDIKPIGNKEKTGYPTQKPIALLDRIIRVSCPENGVVFDPFCGCGTTIRSATRNNRKWIGCDIALHSVNLIIKLLEKEEGLKKININDKHQYSLGEKIDKEFKVDGVPVTEQQALTLWKECAAQFEKWIIEYIGGIVNTNPNQPIHDGKIYFGKDNDKEILISVKGGMKKNLKHDHPKALIGELGNNSCEIVCLICRKPKNTTKALSLKTGFYKNTDCLKFQILTIEDILKGKRIEFPRNY